MLFSFPFCLTDQLTDPPTFVRKGVMGRGDWKRETFSYWGIKGLNFSLLVAFKPGYALILLAQALCVFRLQTLCLGQTHSTLFKNLEHNFVVRCRTRWANEFNTFVFYRTSFNRVAHLKTNEKSPNVLNSTVLIGVELNFEPQCKTFCTFLHCWKLLKKTTRTRGV